MPLNDLKDYNPVDAEEFSITRGINKEAFFSWWAALVEEKEFYCVSRYFKGT